MNVEPAPFSWPSPFVQRLTIAAALAGAEAGADAALDAGADAGAWLGGSAVGVGGVGVAALLQAPRTRTAIAAMVPKRFAAAIKGFSSWGRLASGRPDRH